MPRITRRRFVGVSTLAGVLAAAPRLGAAAQLRPAHGSDLVPLGRSGLQSSLLALGTAASLDLGQRRFTALVHHALDRGIRYIDTADMSFAHLALRRALQGVPREKYLLQTKTRALHPQAAKADVERFRRELAVDRIDSLLLHCMTSPSWHLDMRPVIDVLHDAKHKGRIGAVGVSCHGWAALAASAECQGLDVQLVRINPFAAAMDAPPPQVAHLLRRLHAAGRGVLAMKLYGQDGLDSPAQRLQSLQYVLGLGCVDALTIGFRSIEHLDETLALIQHALSPQSAA